MNPHPPDRAKHGTLKDWIATRPVGEWQCPQDAGFKHWGATRNILCRLHQPKSYVSKHRAGKLYFLILPAIP